MENYDHSAAIIEYESGDMESMGDIIELFQFLVDSGMAWTLQGQYGRTARELIDRGIIDDKV